ncbi:MAG: pyridoxal-phosphate dependent enzyme, partial [candidate division Zixibacteria bacterium]|nr:pyridoxal-phosphate dependent enzyme [candidate division Zixibacteria bacterium]
MCKFYINKHLEDDFSLSEKINILFDSSDILNFHRSINGYKPTPLYSLKSLSAKFGIKDIFVKDESLRFDLNAFKVLGASYAIYRFLKKRYEQITGVEMENLFSSNVKKTLPLYTF